MKILAYMVLGLAFCASLIIKRRHREGLPPVRWYEWLIAAALWPIMVVAFVYFVARSFREALTGQL